MKLDNPTKIVTLVSTIVGIMISVAGYFGSLKLQSLETRIKALDEVEKGIDLSTKTYDLSPRLITEFELPLARTFAEEYSKNSSMLIPTTELTQEFESNIVNWKKRKGLMTGKACEGLLARQIVTLMVTELRGQSSPESDRNQAQIVLASVSGATNLFGTVLVPIEISWTNKITKQRETKKIMESQVSKLRVKLLGAEIGTACN